LEQQLQLHEVFIEIDNTMASLVQGAQEARRLVSIPTGSLDGLDARVRESISRLFNRDAIEAAGAWFLPDVKRLDVGWLNFPFFHRHHPRLASAAVAKTTAKIDRLDEESLFLWSTAGPLFGLLFAPFRLRGPDAGKADVSGWQDVAVFYAAASVSPEPLEPFLPGRGWSRLDAGERSTLKAVLMKAIEGLDALAVARAYRLFCLRTLAERHYRVSKNGRALRRKVLAKDYEPTLVAFFSGNWIGWLDYIGEAPHPDEEIARTLPSTKLFVAPEAGSSSRIDAVARSTGTSPAQVAEVLAALYGQSQTRSPVDERVDVLRRFWGVFDEVHARHTVGDGTLWGLIGDRTFPFERGGLAERDASVADRLLPADLLAAIDRLWQTCVLPQWPNRLVFEVFPRAAMAETFGAALAFWHQAALTAWFVSEGPYSRTTLSGLEKHRRKLLDQLIELGTPISTALFTELGDAERLQGSPQRIWNSESLGDGISMATSAGSRLGGYDRFNAIITKYRRQWQAEHLDGYLRKLWETELTAAQQEVHRHAADRGAAPSAKQFAAMVAPAADHWFAGDCSLLASVIAVKSPVTPSRARRIDGSGQEFAERLYRRLVTRSQRRPDKHFEAGAAYFAKQGVALVQSWEASDEIPRYEKAGAKVMGYLREDVFGAVSPEDGWNEYLEILEVTSQRERPPTETLRGGTGTGPV
jgi:hypothetical protein